MASDLNVYSVIGRITRDVEVKYAPGGSAYCEIGIANNQRKKVGEQWQDKASFFDVTVWGKQAEIAGQYLRKGSQVSFLAHLEQDSWEDKSTGQKRSKVKIICDQLYMLGGGKGQSRDEQRQSESGEESQERPSSSDSLSEPGEDSVPF